jgi:hypothetical protein
VGVRWNSWNHFGCGINENLIKQTGTPAPLPNETNITKIALKKYHINKRKIFCVFAQKVMKQIKKEAKKLLHVAVGREEGKKMVLSAMSSLCGLSTV